MKALSMPTGFCQPTQDELTVLESLVENRLSGQLHGFQLSATNGGLVLRGRTRSYYGKQLAQHAVMEATALPILANEIEIVQTPR